MSYCRWSSDDHQCDVYVYEDCMGGFTTHVAANRLKFNQPLPDPVPFKEENFKAWYARHQEVSSMLDKADRYPIGLPHDGESFNDPTERACADRLMALKAIGYQVPQYAIDALLEEARNEQD